MGRNGSRARKRTRMEIEAPSDVSLPGQIIQVIVTSEEEEIQSFENYKVDANSMSSKRIIFGKADIPLIRPQSYSNALMMDNGNGNIPQLNFAAGETGNVGFQRISEESSPNIENPNTNHNQEKINEVSGTGWYDYFWSFISSSTPPIMESLIKE